MQAASQLKLDLVSIDGAWSGTAGDALVVLLNSVGDSVASSALSAALVNTAGEWYFEGEDGWIPMDDALGAELESDFKSSVAVSKHRCYGHEYAFDLQQMKQRNLQTNKVRPIRRVKLEANGGGPNRQVLDFSDFLQENKDKDKELWTQLLQYWEKGLTHTRRQHKWMGFGCSSVAIDSPEGQGVLTAVATSISNGPVPRVLEVWRIQNEELMRDFLHFGAKLRRELTAEGKAGLLRCASLFHGTRNFENVYSIGATGFDRNYSAAREAVTAYGKGAYFAVSAAYSLRGYSCHHESLGGNLVFLASVWVAEHTRGEPTMLNPPFKRGSGCLRYETTVDNPNKPTMHVAYRDGQSYPSYLIRFEDRGESAHSQPPSGPGFGFATHAPPPLFGGGMFAAAPQAPPPLFGGGMFAAAPQAPPSVFGNFSGTMGVPASVFSGTQAPPSVFGGTFPYKSG